MASVKVRGSITPCAFLARGEERTVQRTGFVEALIRQGFLDVIEDGGDNPPHGRPVSEEQVDAEAQAVRDELGVPARNASTGTWKQFLADKGIEFDADTRRDDLVELWDNYDPEPVPEPAASSSEA